MIFKTAMSKSQIITRKSEMNQSNYKCSSFVTFAQTVADCKTDLSASLLCKT